MIFDDLDLFILREIWEAECTTTWQMAKKYFKLPEVDTREQKREINCKHQLIKDRLRKLSNHGLIVITKSKPNGDISKNIYTLKIKNMKIGNHRFPDRYARAISLRLSNKWEVFEL